MRVLTRSTLSISSADFGTQVSDNGVLLMPEALVDLMRKSGLRTVEEFLGLIEAFPSSVMHELSWSKPDLDTATAKLKTQLHGHVHDSILNPVPRPRPGMGALPPRSR